MNEQLFAILMKTVEHLPQSLVLLWGIYKLAPRVAKLELRVGAHENALPILKLAPDPEPSRARR